MAEKERKKKKEERKKKRRRKKEEEEKKKKERKKKKEERKKERKRRKKERKRRRRNGKANGLSTFSRRKEGISSWEVNVSLFVFVICLHFTVLLFLFSQNRFVRCD